MHRIGLITDIHGNDLALKEALKRLDGKVDEIICLGDLIGIGPNGNEVIEIVKKIKNFSCVLGNHDRYLLYGFDNPYSCTQADHQEWIKNHVSKENQEYLKTIPIEIERIYNNKTLLFLHYARRSKDGMRFEFIEHEPSEEKLNKLFKETEADYYFFGHEHFPSIIKGEKTYIDVGSLGCPYPNKDEGRYGILSIGKHIVYKAYTFTYDSSKIVEDMVNKKMPNTDFIRKNFYMQ